MLEPRRLAARAAAARMASLRGERIGETVGYRIRFESKVSARTRIEVLTEGILARRLQSDRFLTVDFRPEIYSPLGMDWIARSGMKSLIQRHCPDLAPLMPRDASAFAPWRPIIPGAATPS